MKKMQGNKYWMLGLIGLLMANSSIAGSGTAAKVVVENQIDDQRNDYLGKAGEIVFMVDSPETPIVVHDGSTTGGVQLVSIHGAVPRVSTVTITNDAEWVGWSTTGELRTNALIFLDVGEWLESPVLIGGVSSYDDSGISSDASATSWSVVVYTNSSDTSVSLPYTGTDARLRITAVSSVGTMGAGEVGVSVAGMSIVSYTQPELLALDDYVSQFRLVDVPTDDEHVARLSTVTDHYMLALGYTDTEIIKYDKDTGKVIRGSMVFAGSGWAFSPTKSDTNATMQIAWGGFPMLEFLLGVAGCTIDTFTATNGTTATFGIATNGVSTAPVVEYATDLIAADWRPVTVISNSYPTVVGSNYVIEIDSPDGDAVYFRALRRTSGSINAFSDITTPAGNSIDNSVQDGLANGNVGVFGAEYVAMGGATSNETLVVDDDGATVDGWLEVFDDPLGNNGVGNRLFNDGRHPLRTDGITTNLNGFVVVDGQITGTY